MRRILLVTLLLFGSELLFAQNPNFVPFYRMWSDSAGDHFYTTNPDEVRIVTTTQGYVYEGIQCYVSGSSYTGGVPLYRYWKESIGDHFYVTTEEQRTDAINRGYVSEGIQAYVSPASLPGLVPLYRFWNSTIGDHFYVTTPDQRQQALDRGYVAEGIQCYVSPDGGLNSFIPWFKFRYDLQNTGRSPYQGKPGNLKWRYLTGSGVYSSPSLSSDGTIYVGSSDGYLYALNPNGTLRWRYVTGGGYSSPAIGSDGTIYVGSTDKYLYALNSDGTLKWRYLTGDWVNSSPAIGPNGTIYVGSNDYYLYALNPDGTRKWRYLSGGYIGSSPALAADGTIYLGSGDKYLYAINPNGTLKWRYLTGGTVDSSPAIGSDGTIYVGSNDYYLYALNPDGTRKWRYYTGDRIGSSPAIGADGTIYIGDRSGYLYTLNPDGTLKWRYLTGSWVYSSPAIGADGTIYVGSYDDYLYVLNPDGTRKWRYSTGNDVYSSPAIAPDGTIYVGSSDGYFYAIGNNAPVLSWTDETNYTSDGLHPETGDRNTTFTFRVKYTDADNDAPKHGYPKVHIMKGAGNVPVASSTMTYISGNYDTGAIYTYSLKFSTPATDYNYYFETYDVWGASATTTSVDAPEVINNPPVLSWTGELNYENDGLHPEVGTSTTNFVFRVKYTDIDNDSPSSGYPKAVIQKGGTGFRTVSSIYSRTTGLSIPDNYSVGITTAMYIPDNYTISEVNVYVAIWHDYKQQLIVELTSPNNTTVRLHNRTAGGGYGIWYDTDMAVDGPGSLNDFIGQSSQGEWKLKVSDNVSGYTGYLDVWKLEIIDRTGGIMMTAVESSDTDYTDGKLYISTVTGLSDSLDYTYYFEAKDKWGTFAVGVATSSVNAPDVDGTAPTNPTSANGWVQPEKWNSLISGWDSYVYPRPYFEWTPATDMSGIGGYSVAFTTNQYFNPSTEITQTTTFYVVVSSCTGSQIYYLRLRAVDNFGNWSSPATLFTYYYDKIPPEAISNLTIVDRDYKSVTIKWWQPGEDGPGSYGAPKAFSLKYSSVSTITEANWWLAKEVSGLPSPGSYGDMFTLRVTGLAPLTTHYFAIKSRDEQWQWSGISNVVSTMTVDYPRLAGSQYPKFRYDLANTGRSPYYATQSSNIKWYYPTGGVVYSPVVGADGTIYVGSDDYYLYALNPDKTLKWRYLTGGYVRCAPAIAIDGTIYVGSDEYYLHAIKPDGTRKWRYLTGGSVRSSPMIGTDGTVYFGAADKKVYALEGDGSFKWSYTTGGAIYSAPAISAEGIIYIGSSDGKLYSIKPDGTLNWDFTTPAAINSSPAIGPDGTIYVGVSNGRFYAFNPNGTAKWFYNTGGAINSSPAIGSDGTIVFGSDDFKVYALNPDGTLKWSYQTGDKVQSSPTIDASGTVYVGSNDAVVYALKLSDGSLVWQAITGKAVKSSPAIGAEGTVYVGSDDNRLYAFGSVVEIKITSPNGGEKWIDGLPKDITWTAPTTITSIAIYYSTDTGRNWMKIAENETNDGSYRWTVPAITTLTACRIKIIGTGTGISSFDVSDEDFIIGITYSIKGYVKTATGLAMPEVSVTLSGTSSGTYVTGNSGYCEFLNLAGGNYTVKPEKEDYTFTPSSRSYAPLNSNQVNQDFTGTYAQITEYQFALKWPQEIAYKFFIPSDVAIDKNGNVYIADVSEIVFISTTDMQINYRIQKFNSAGALVTKWTYGPSEEGLARSVAVDSAGNVYVTLENEVRKFDSNGTLLKKWGTYGQGDGQFSECEGITIDANGNIYVVDSANERVQKFDSNGNFLLKWGGDGTGNGQFNSPMGIAVDLNGNVYVADRNNNRVQKFDSNGNFLLKWGSEGGANGQFREPYDVVVDTSGNVYVSDTETYSYGSIVRNARVQKFDSHGNFLLKWGSYGTGDGRFDSSAGILGLGIDPSGNIWVADSGNNRVQKFNSNGTFLSKWDASGSGDGQFNFPRGIAKDSSGNIYVGDATNHRIQKFSSEGTFLTKWGSQGSGDGQFSFPRGVAIDSNDNIYVADTGNNRIQKFSSNGTFINKWGSYSFGGVAVDSNNYIYAVDTRNNRVQKFSSDGTFITQWGSYGSGNGQLNSPEGIAVDSKGNVYVADTKNERIQKFNSTGTFISKIEYEDLYNPYGVTVDLNDNVYVVGEFIGIYKFNSRGVFITKWGSVGNNDGEFLNPYGIVVDNSGDVYVADTLNHRIQKFAPGVGVTVYSIKGYVKDSAGTGINGVTVTMGGAAAATYNTGANGYYEFTGLSRGNYIVTPSKNGWNFSPERRSYTPLAGNQENQNFVGTLSLVGVSTGTISGKVTKDDGTTAISGVLVEALQGGGLINQATTDSSGNYSITLATGTYDARASASGYETKVVSGYVVSVGSTTTVNFALVETAVPTYYIKGYVKDSIGTRINGVTMSLTGAVTKSTTTASTGYYEFLNLSSGTYTVTPSKTNYTFIPSSRTYSPLNSNQDNQDFAGTLSAVVISTGTISGKVTKSNGTTVISGVLVEALQSGSLINQATTDSSGNYSITLATGTYDVRASASGYAVKQVSGVVVIANQTTTVNFAIISTSPILGVSVTSLSFGEIVKGKSKTLSFTITNTEGGTLTGNITKDRDWISVSPTSFSLSTGTSQNISVTVSPTRELADYVTYTGAVSITSNGGNATVNITVIPTCAIAYPEPISLSSGKELTFWGTGVAYGTIRIYTLTGELVKELREANGYDKITWDLTNENGEKIVRGIYLYTATNPKEPKGNRGKITVIK